MPNAIIGICALILCLMIFFIISIRKMKNSGHTYAVYYIRDGQIIMNTALLQPAYRIDEIDYIKMRCDYIRGLLGFFSRSPRRKIGQFQIFTKDGRKSRIFLFDHTVIDNRLTFEYNNYWKIMDAIEKMRIELEAYGIKCDTTVYLPPGVYP